MRAGHPGHPQQEAAASDGAAQPLQAADLHHQGDDQPVEHLPPKHPQGGHNPRHAMYFLIIKFIVLYSTVEHNLRHTIYLPYLSKNKETIVVKFIFTHPDLGQVS